MLMPTRLPLRPRIFTESLPWRVRCKALTATPGWFFSKAFKSAGCSRSICAAPISLTVRAGAVACTLTVGSSMAVSVA